MSDMQDLYQELILDHNKRPRNRRELADANHHAVGHNPLCGDRVTIYARVEGDRITEATFDGAGCAISTASASLMTQAIKGKSVDEARELLARFHAMLTDDQSADANGAEMGKLRAFAGVKKYPARVKCATLAWHTLDAALTDEEKVVTTE